MKQNETADISYELGLKFYLFAICFLVRVGFFHMQYPIFKNLSLGAKKEYGSYLNFEEKKSKRNPFFTILISSNNSIINALQR